MTGPTTSSQPARRRASEGLASAWSRIDWNQPFARLAVCHILSVSGETLLAVSLAGSLFFKVDPAQGREKVVLGLLFTMAPFALVGPFIGPFVDRIKGGPRVVIQLSMALRVLIAVFMTIAVANDSLALFLGAFSMLVAAKTYQIARAAVVPSTVLDEHELVEANSKLQLLSGLAAVVAGAIGGVMLQIDAVVVTAFMVVVFAAATVAAFRVRLLDGSPANTERAGVFEGDPTSAASEGPDEIAEMASVSVLVAGYVMAVLRMVVGLVTLLLAFQLRGEAQRLSPLDFAVNQTVLAASRAGTTGVHSIVVLPPPQWYFGVVLGVSVVGGIVGAALAPRLRQLTSEHRILAASCVLVAVVGVVGMMSDGLLGYVALAGGVAIAAALGKQAFDALVQRETADSALGRVFSRFEARFQIVWVVGALLPSLIRIPVPLGAGLVTLSAIAGTAVILTGVRPRPVQAALATPAGQSVVDRLPKQFRRQDRESQEFPENP